MQTQFTPSPQEILTACQEIQRGWRPHVERERRVIKNPPVDVPWVWSADLVSDNPKRQGDLR
ncbi:MAG: hypothetical protein ACYC0X_17885 [Pirellulaceae bacterium]